MDRVLHWYDEINEMHEVGEEHCLNVVLKESPGQDAEGKKRKLLVLFRNYISTLDLNKLELKLKCQHPWTSIWNNKSEIKHLKTVWNLKSKTWNPKSEIQNLKYKIWNTKSEIQNSKSGVSNPKSQIRILKSKIWNSKSDIQNLKFKISNPQFKIWNLKSVICNL